MTDDVDQDAHRDTLNPAPQNPRYQKRLEEKRNVTSRVSETCRFIGFGLILAYYTASVGGARVADPFLESPLHLVGVAGVLTIFFDYLQYVCGLEAVKAALTREDYKYDDESLFYRARHWCYDFKQATAVIGSLLLIYSVVSGDF